MNQTLTVERCLVLGTHFAKFPSVQAIQKEFGFKGFTLMILVLSELSRRESGIVFDNEFRYRIARIFPDVSRNLVGMVIYRMVGLGLLAVKGNMLVAPSADTVNEPENNGFHAVPYRFVQIDNRVSSDKTPVKFDKTPVKFEETPTAGAVSSDKTSVMSEKSTDNQDFSVINS